MTNLSAFHTSLQAVHDAAEVRRVEAAKLQTHTTPNLYHSSFPLSIALSACAPMGPISGGVATWGVESQKKLLAISFFYLSRYNDQI